MPGYVTSAERAAGVGEPEGGSLRPRAWRCAAGGTRGYLELCAGDPEARGLRGRLEAGSGDCPSARAGPQPAAVTLRFWTLDRGGGSSTAPGRPFRVRSIQNRTFSRMWTSNRARWAHFALLPAVGWCWCCPGREAVSLVPRIIGFSLNRSGSCEKRGGRPRAAPVVVAHLLLWTRGPADTSNPVSHQLFLAPPACPPCEFARIPSLTGISWDEEPISPGTL